VAKSKPEPASEPVPAVLEDGYFAWSRDPSVSMFAVVPLWIVYEGLRLSLVPSERNLSEWILLDVMSKLPAAAKAAIYIALGLGVFRAMRQVVIRDLPWARVGLVLVLEGSVYGLMLGPLAGALADPAVRFLGSDVMHPRLVQDLVGSLGAGIFEELVFRLGLMSLLVWMWLRATSAFRLPRALGGVLAVVVSAVLFSLHHHLREDFDRGVFLFRTMAGVLLGFLFWFRGFGVCVYTHAMYDVYYFLTHDPR
jgi:membrane protease YdiL (CAAX protease family)